MATITLSCQQIEQASEISIDKNGSFIQSIHPTKRARPECSRLYERLDPVMSHIMNHGVKDALLEKFGQLLIKLEEFLSTYIKNSNANKKIIHFRQRKSYLHDFSRLNLEIRSIYDNLGIEYSIETFRQQDIQDQRQAYRTALYNLLNEMTEAEKVSNEKKQALLNDIHAYPTGLILFLSLNKYMGLSVKERQLLSNDVGKFCETLQLSFIQAPSTSSKKVDGKSLYVASVSIDTVDDTSSISTVNEVLPSVVSPSSFKNVLKLVQKMKNNYFLQAQLDAKLVQMEKEIDSSVAIGTFHRRHNVSLKRFPASVLQDSKLKQVIQQEILLLKCLGNYPTILSCYGYVVNGPSLQIVYELAPYGSLDKVLRENKVQSFPLSLMVAWMSDLADAMQFLHSKGIIHGDIKAENILVFERLETKLCNFHSAKSANEMNLSNHFHLASSSGEIAQKTLYFTFDLSAFWNTSLQILTRCSFVDRETCLQEKDKVLAQAITRFPLSVYNISSSVYNMLTSLLLVEKRNDLITSKEVSDQLFHVLEETCDGDPRDSSNPFGMQIKQIEKTIISSTEEIQQVVQFMDLIENGGNPDNAKLNENSLALQLILQRLKERNGKFQQNIDIKGRKGYMNIANSIQSSIPQTEIIIDQRKILREWLETVCAAPSGIAENIACSFIQHQIYSLDILQQRVKSNPSFLKKIHMGDRTLRRRIYETLKSSSNVNSI